MSRVREYTHVFSCPRRVTATLRVNLDQAAGGIGCVWRGLERGKEASALIPEYREFAHTVMGDVARQTGQKIMYLLEASAQAVEVWIYAPGEPPLLADTVIKNSGKKG